MTTLREYVEYLVYKTYRELEIDALSTHFKFVEDGVLITVLKEGQSKQVKIKHDQPVIDTFKDFLHRESLFCEEDVS